MAWCNSREEQLVTILRCSHEPLSGHELGAMIGMSYRQTRALITHLRRDHNMSICSTPNEGYYWPRRRSSASHTLASMQSRIDAMVAVKEGIERGLDREFGAPRLFDYEEAS